jgi:uncharacterized lipoprotein YbaY
MAALLLAGLIAGCAYTRVPFEEGGPFEGVLTDEAVITGMLTYREDVALAPEAIVEVRLIDTSEGGPHAPTVAETTFLAAGQQVPIPFELHFDLTRIEPRRSYALRATIRSGGSIRFVTAQDAPIAPSAQPVTMNLLLVPPEKPES